MPYSRYLIGPITWYSVLILCGIVLAILLAGREEKRLRLPEETVIDLALLCIPCGIAGARLYYVIFSWEYFAGDLLRILRIWEGGLAIYGGVIGGAAAVLLYAWRKRLHPGLLCDCIAPGLALAQGIGRWGNFFNMEAYGLTVTDPQWQFFPFAVLIPQEGGSMWHMATFFYESVWDVSVFALLWFTRKQRRHRGDGILQYLLLYGCGRLVTEELRMDSLMGGTFRVSQLLSILLVLVSLGLFLYRACRRNRQFRMSRCRLSINDTAVGLYVLLAILGGFLLLTPHTILWNLLFSGGSIVCLLLIYPLT